MLHRAHAAGAVEHDQGFQHVIDLIQLDIEPQGGRATEATDGSRPPMRLLPHCSGQWAQPAPAGRQCAPRHSKAPHCSPELCGAPLLWVPDGPQGRAMPLRIIARATYSARGAKCRTKGDPWSWSCRSRRSAP